MSALSDYELRPLSLDAAELEATVALLRRAFPGAPRFTREYLEWAYLANPHGRARGCNAYARDGSLAAHYVTLPMAAEVGGRPGRGLLSLNTATDPGHQGRGLFTRLAERTYADAAAAGCEFVVGVANSRSTPGFTRKLGFRLVAPLEARVGFGAPRGAETDPELDFRPQYASGQLSWRLANPASRYLRLRSGDGEWWGARTDALGIVALLGRLPEGGEEGFALGQAARLAPRLWLGLDPGLSWMAPASFPIPGLIRPSPLNFIFRDLTARGFFPRADRVRFHGADFDAY